MRWILILGFVGIVLAACSPSQTSTLPEGCDPSYEGAEACTMEYNPVCATLENGSEKTMGNECVACTSDEKVVSISSGECKADTNNTMPGEEFYTSCTEPRPEMCTEQYDPVCAAVDTGVRCVTTPCPSARYETRGNACSACSDSDVFGFFDGACEEQLFVICEPTQTGFSAEDYAHEQGGICVDECPTGFDPYTTQIGVQLCIVHYGEAEIKEWPTCERSNDTCNCVRTTQTTTGEQIEDAQYRCVPEQYASRLLFTSGQDRLDENGEQSVAIA